LVFQFYEWGALRIDYKNSLDERSRVRSHVLLLPALRLRSVSRSYFDLVKDVELNQSSEACRFGFVEICVQVSSILNIGSSTAWYAQHYQY
jgi:hypothetical protein